MNYLRASSRGIKSGNYYLIDARPNTITQNCYFPPQADRRYFVRLNMIPNISKLRGQFGYSQEYLAKQIGVSRPTFIQIEKNERELTVPEAKKLADMFNMGLIDFLEGKTKSEPGPKVFLKKPEKSLRKDFRIEVPSDKVAKFKEILLYILTKVGAQPNIGETALYKLLYFIDFDYYERYGEKLLGATYIKNHYGPTPVEFKEIAESMEKAGELEKIKSRYFQYQQKKYLPLRRPNLNCFSAQEIKLIDKTLDKLAEKNAKELSDYSHKDVPWRTAKEGDVIDYNLAFQREYPYACYEHFTEGEINSWKTTEKYLDPLTKEETEYYKSLAKKNEKERNQMR
jgi:DNA-binding XRE family transcriptional regulator